MPRTLLASAAAIAAATLATVSFAHEEDWRKIADRTLPNFGEIYRNLDAYNPAALSRSTDANASGMTLLSNVPLNQLSNDSVGDGADCWGFVTDTGREIAIIGKGNGHGFVDVTDPINPLVIGFIPSATSMWHDVKVIGDYAYAVNESGNGIQVIDISDADNGNITLVRNVSNGSHTTTHNIIANEESGWLYICGANVGNGGLIAVDVATDPENPTFAGQWTNTYVHDAQVVTMKTGPLAGREIAFCFTEGSGFRVVDVTDKSNMVQIGAGTYPGVRYCHQGWISEDEQWLYINDELDEGSTVSVTTTRVFDISDLTAPVFAGTFTTGLSAIDHNLYTHEGLIFQANYRSGLRVFDATQNPANPTEIASYDTFPGSDSSSFNGAWSVYPYFPSGNIIVSDIESGLFVLRLDVGPTASSIILDITSVPDQINPSEPLLVTATAITNNATIDSEGVRLAYTVGDSSEVEIAMTPTGAPNEFSASVPGQQCFETIEVRVISESEEGGSFATPPQQVMVFEEEFTIGDSETNIGDWTTSQTATSGGWQFGEPAAGDRGDPSEDADGTNQAWLTENVAGNTDVDDGTVSLVSESFDIQEGGTVEYAYWLNDISTGQLGAEDFYRVEVRVDGGSWQLAREYTSAAAVWRTDTLTFGDGADYPASSSVELRFTVADNAPGDVVEGGLDALTVFRRTCDDVCETDLDGSGATDITDLLQLLAVFDTASSAGDTDGDGDTDISDLLMLLSAYDTSCN